MDWKESLLLEAKNKRMCMENFRALACCEAKTHAIELYVKTIDWALEENYPSIDFLRKEFSNYECEGFFVDKTFDGDTLSGKQVYVFHHCHGEINIAMDYEKYIIPMMYFANGCEMTVTCGQKNNPAIKVPLYIFGDNSISCRENGNVEFNIYKK